MKKIIFQKKYFKHPKGSNERLRRGCQALILIQGKYRYFKYLALYLHTTKSVYITTFIYSKEKESVFSNKLTHWATFIKFFIQKFLILMMVKLGRSKEARIKHIIINWWGEGLLNIIVFISEKCFVAKLCFVECYLDFLQLTFKTFCLT